MTDHSDNAGITETTIADPTVVSQNKLVVQLMQRVTDMEVQMKKTHELANLAITANLQRPGHEGPSVHFPSLDLAHQPVSTSTNPPIVPVQASPIINLTTPDVVPSNILSQNPPNTRVDSSFHIAHTVQPEIQAPDKYNPPATQTLPPKIPFHTTIFSNPHNPQSTYPEVDLYQEKKKE